MEVAEGFKNTSYNCECVVCGKKLHRKPSYINKTKNITCSYECCYKLKKQTMAGKNNHQYGLVGELNSSYKNGEFISNLGYKKIYAPKHPLSKNNYILEHRLVSESYLLDSINSVEYNNLRCLSPEFVVHHLDFDRLNNDINNLAIMKKNDHIKFHNYLREIIRNKKGEIINVTNHNEELSKQELRNKFFEFVNKNDIYFSALPTAMYNKKIMELAATDYDIVEVNTF